MNFAIKKILTVVVLSLVILAAYTAHVSAQTKVDTALSQYNIVFPIVELDNCSDLTTCDLYCEDPVNNAKCVTYAKDHGFYKQDPVHKSDEQFWKRVQARLGCKSRQTCELFCSQETNHQVCGGFAEEEGIVGGIVKTGADVAILAQAQVELGCDTKAICQSVCSLQENTDKCSRFAGRVGLRGGDVTHGPGGCQSEQTCKSFCLDPGHFDECKVFAPRDVDYVGPGECDSRNSCRRFCEEHPEECRSYAPGTSGVYVPVSCETGKQIGPGGICTQGNRIDEAKNCLRQGNYWSGDGCQGQAPKGVHVTDEQVDEIKFAPREEWGGCRSPGECHDFCKSNPGKCGRFVEEAPRPVEAVEIVEIETIEVGGVSQVDDDELEEARRDWPVNKIEPKRYDKEVEREEIEESHQESISFPELVSPERIEGSEYSGSVVKGAADKVGVTGIWTSLKEWVWGLINPNLER